MRQGYLLVGGGRMARHMAHYFDLLGVRHRAWTRDRGRDILADHARRSEAVLLLISDGALESFVAAHGDVLGDTPLVHFSGSVRVPGVQGCHPLGSFGTTLHQEALYRSITFVCEPGPRSFRELFPSLPNPHLTLDPSLRPLYHALAVLSGNFTVLLWQKAVRGWAELGVPRDAAMAYLATVASSITSDMGGSLTGPIARGDLGTVGANLDALGDDPWAGVYRAVLAAVKSDRERGAS